MRLNNKRAATVMPAQLNRLEVALHKVRNRVGMIKNDDLAIIGEVAKMYADLGDKVESEFLDEQLRLATIIKLDLD